MKKFYEKALPRQGVYCVTGIKDGKAHNLFADTHEQLYEHIDDLVKDGANVFVAPNSFKSFSRMADNAAYAKSFFIDLDVGEGERKYPNKVEAVKALFEFVDGKLPEPVIIDSGGGVHAYWIFDEDIPIAQWRPYARKFKEFCLKSIKIDPVVTADAARIMRCPNTYNYKTNPPKPTKFIYDEINEYSFDEFKEFLGEIELDLSDILASAEKGLDEDTRKLFGGENFSTEFSVIAKSSLSGSGCEQIKYAIVNAATLSEPVWYAALSIAQHCIDKDEAIHILSEDHPGYDRAKTIVKAKQTDGKPQSCVQFDAVNPGICEGCPQRGKITNPLFFGRTFQEAPTATDSIWKEPDGKEVPKFPPDLKPYMRGLHGGVYYLPPSSRSDDGSVEQDPPLRIFKYDLFPIKRMNSPHDGDCLLMRCLLPHDEPREFLLPMSSAGSQDQLRAILAKHGAVYDPGHSLHAIRYINKWDDYMKEVKKAELMRMQMGWTEKKDAFVLGGIEIIPDGTERPSPSSPFVKGISKLLHPLGDYKKWQDAFNKLNKPGFEMHAFGGLMGFGSILMNYTSTSGAVVSFTGDSGCGKTGALYACLSIWGQPKELSVFDATENGMVGRYLGLHNLPLGCDEVSNKKSEHLSNLIHRISHGKAKIRMQASVNAERELEYSASLLSLMTTNQPIYDKMIGFKGSPDGEVARLMEFSIIKPFGLTHDLGKEIFDVFRHNYGWAGPEFVRYCYKVGDARIKELIAEWANKFTKDFGSEAAYRFYENTTAATFTAGQLANEANIINADLNRIYRVLFDNMCSVRDSTPINKYDYKGLVTDFVHKYHRNFLIIDDVRVIQEPFNDFVGRTDVHTKRRYIPKTVMHKFLAEHQVSVRSFDAALKEEGFYIPVNKQRLSNGWKDGQKTSPIAMYCFKFDQGEDEPTTN
jgi:hypothetical protein